MYTTLDKQLLTLDLDLQNDMAQYQTQSSCNPFGLPNHNWNTRKKNLRLVTSWMCERAPISMGSKICDSCRKKLSKTTVEVIVDKSDSEHGDDDGDEDYSPEAESSELFVDASEAISTLNQCLVTIGESPYVKRKARQRHYLEVKNQPITAILQSKFSASTIS